jgi:hypothetical protein
MFIIRLNRRMTICTLTSFPVHYGQVGVAVVAVAVVVVGGVLGDANAQALHELAWINH